MILANPVSSSPASGAGLAGQAAGLAAGQATGAGLMAGTPSMFALDLGVATAGMRTTASASAASPSAASQGSGGRGGIPLAGLRELQVDASMLVQMDIEAGVPAAVPPRGWFADAVRAGKDVVAGALTGEGAAGQLATDLAVDGSAADTVLDIAAQADSPAGIAGILSGMIATGGQASAALTNTPAGARFSADLSAQAAVGAPAGLAGTATGETGAAGGAATGSAISGTGAAGTGSALAQPGAGTTPGEVASDNGDGPRLASASVSLSSKGAGGMSGGLVLDAAGGGNSQAVAGTVTAGSTSPASDAAAAQKVPAVTTQASDMQAGAASAGNGAAGVGAAGVGTMGAGAAVAGSAGAVLSSEILSAGVSLPGGNTVEGTPATDAGTSTETDRSAGVAGRIDGQGGSAAMSVSATAATGGASAEPGLARAAVASLAATTGATGTSRTGADGSAGASFSSDAGDAAIGVETAVRASSEPQARDIPGQLPKSQTAESQTAGSQTAGSQAGSRGIGLRAGGDQAHAMTADAGVGELPDAAGTAPAKTETATRSAAADHARLDASPSAGTTARVTVAREAPANGKLSISGAVQASALAGGVIPTGDMDISITASTATDGATGATGATATGAGTGTALREQGTVAALQGLTGQAASVLPRGEASAAARASELDYAQAVEEAMAGTPGQDGEGAGAAREGNGKPAASAAAQAAATQPVEIQRPGVSAAALAFAAAMADGDASQGDGGDPFNGLTEIARADAQASVSTAALRGSTAALPQNAAVASAHLAAEVARFAQKGQTRFQIRMDPPELGRVDVELKVSRDGTVRAHLSVERSETLDMFLRDQRGLERALDAAGLKLESGGLEMSLKNQNGSTAFDRGEGGDSRSAQPGEGGVLQKEDGDTLPMAAARAYVSGASGALDIQI